MEQPIILFDITEDLYQKFVHMTDDQEKDYLVSLPKEKAEFHMDILNYAINHFGKKLNPHGGGTIKRVGDTFHLSGKSKVLGNFNKEKVTQILQKAYPESHIILESN